MNESLVKYLAGLLDADGSLSFNFREDGARGRYFVGLTLRLTASDEVDRNRFVERLPELTGMGSTSRYGKNKQFCVWNVSARRDLEMLLPRLIKHMVIKAKHWDWLLNTWRGIKRMSYGSTSVTLEEREAMTEESASSRRERVGPIHAKNHPTWAWLAGYLDGDGWYLHRFNREQNYYQMHVGAVAHDNDASVLQFLQRSFGGHIAPHSKTGGCMVWKRNLGVRDRAFALRFLPGVVKHSRLKRHKIENMIHHHQQRLSGPGLKG